MARAFFHKIRLKVKSCALFIAAIGILKK